MVNLVSCSGTKGLAPDDKLFAKTEVSFTDEGNITEDSSVKKAVTTSLLQENSPGILNIKTGIYNLFDEPKKRGIKRGIKYGLGAKPIVFESRKVAITEKRIQKAMVDDGYLQAIASCDSTLQGRKVKIVCEATLGSRYIIDSVFYMEDTLPVSKSLIYLHKLDYTKSGDYLQMKNLVLDRDEVVEVAKNNGYPYINQQDVIYFVDTLVGENRVDVHMRLRATEDTLKYQRYKYGDIFINPNYSLEVDNPTDTTSMEVFDNYKMVSGYDFLKEDAVREAVFIREHTIYDARRSKITNDRLQDLGLFKFVNVKTLVNPIDHTIDHFINLTTHKMESVSGELELNNRQGNFLGFLGKVTYSNRNIFGGAEKLDLTLSGGLETQFGDKQSFINTSDVKFEASITVPKVLLPIISFQTNRNFIPKTTMSFSVSQNQRLEFYTVRSLNAQYGFRWNETEEKSSFFRPIDLSWLVLANTTPAFDTILLNDPRQALSFQTTLLSSSSYEYVFNKIDKYDPANQLYFKGSIESAGNILSLFIKPSVPGGQAEIGGTPFAQYVKFTSDVRKYWSLGEFGSIASKLILGAGYAFGNSAELPYSRQYSIGGANSLRAFRLRTIGPGEFISALNDNQFIDQTGDIKIESSVEYKFPILGYFKGAFFVDAGNVWLFDSDDELKESGVFKFDRFASQIAVGTGVGLRFDIDFMVLRIDAAFPLRKIGSDGKFGWVISDIRPFDGGWHSRNMIFNLGIGYPF